MCAKSAVLPQLVNYYQAQPFAMLPEAAKIKPRVVTDDNTKKGFLVAGKLNTKYLLAYYVTTLIQNGIEYLICCKDRAPPLSHKTFFCHINAKHIQSVINRFLLSHLYNVKI